MRVTQVLVKFELLNNEAQNACTFWGSGNKPFGDLARLNEQEKAQYPFMTLELNEGILDGSLLEFNASEQTTTAFMSRSVSNENCKFENVWVEGTLDKPYKFIGITLDFGLYYPKKVTVEYYQKNIKLNHKTIDNIDNTWVYVDMRANDIDKVRVVFDESWAPFEYAWLQEFLFGNVIEWTTNDIISGKLQEETDIISKVIPNDTFSLVIYSKTDEFNVINPTGAYAYLLPNQRFKIREFIYDLDHDMGEIKNTREINLGSFYLDSWESMFNKQIKFNLVSPLAQLDKTKYKKSPMYKGTPTDNAYDALKTVFSDCEYDNYLLDEELKNVFLTGYIPVCTHKEAIQQIAFACGDLVFDNRGRPIEVKPFSTDTPQEIESSSIFDPIKVEKKESVTGLNINVHNFVLKPEREEVFKGFLQNGKREILFSSPCENLQATSQDIKITESGINYAVLEVKKDAEYSITGQKYEDKSYKYSKEITDTNQVKKNTLDVDKATLISPNNAEEIAEKLMSFYRAYNLSVEFKFISDGQVTGSNVVFRDNRGQTFAGALIRQNLDISGGFLSSCYIIGYQTNEQIEQDYLKSGQDNPPNQAVELYADENYGII